MKRVSVLFPILATNSYKFIVGVINLMLYYSSYSIHVYRNAKSCMYYTT